VEGDVFHRCEKEPVVNAPRGRKHKLESGNPWSKQEMTSRPVFCEKDEKRKQKQKLKMATNSKTKAKPKLRSLFVPLLT